MADRIYLNVTSVFDHTGYMQPRAITWKDGRTFRIEEIREFRPAANYREGMKGDCYTVIIKGQVRHLFFEKAGSQFTNQLGRWFVEKEK